MKLSALWSFIYKKYMNFHLFYLFLSLCHFRAYFKKMGFNFIFHQNKQIS